MKKLLDVFVLTRREQVVVIVLLLLFLAFTIVQHHRDARETAVEVTR